MTTEVRDKRDARRGVVDVAALLKAIPSEAQQAFYREVLKGQRDADGKLERDPQTGQPVREGVETRVMQLSIEVLNYEAFLAARADDLEAMDEDPPRDIDISQLEQIRAVMLEVEAGKLTTDAALGKLPRETFGPKELARREVANLTRMLIATRSSRDALAVVLADAQEKLRALATS